MQSSYNVSITWLASPAWSAKGMLHNMNLPNLLLVVRNPNTTPCFWMCGGDYCWASSLVATHTSPHALLSPPTYLAELLPLRQLLEGVPLVTLGTGVQRRRSHSPLRQLMSPNLARLAELSCNTQWISGAFVSICAADWQLRTNYAGIHR